MIPGTPVSIYRGATVRFTTTFFDADGNITQPPSAVVNIAYVEDGNEVQTPISMTPPSGSAVTWTAAFDTRELSPGMVAWSIHSGGSIVPFAVQDGAFELLANNANLETF